MFSFTRYTCVCGQNKCPHSLFDLSLTTFDRQLLTDNIHKSCSFGDILTPQIRPSQFASCQTYLNPCL